ncbi:MAG: indolepyruvate oxidoreductase subunit beta [Bacteroidales bacterium]|nr:indolepyruvate oxidoreductase subunit beta [Bacteroidales bacterium]
MRNDIIISGVGGQGIVSISAIIGFAALDAGLFLKQSEVHGMSQRGGDVQSHLRISDKEIYSDLIPKGKADMIISVEPMESLRYLPWLSAEGWLVTNTNPFINIPDYPHIDKIMAEIKSVKNNIAIDADTIAKEIGSVKAANVVILGAASPFLNLPYEKFQGAIKFIFGKKGDAVVNLNLAALEAGRKFSEKNK